MLLFLLSQVVVQVLDHFVCCMLDVRDSFNNYIVFYYFTIHGMERWPGNNTTQMQRSMQIQWPQ
jgi:hypothetical protein